MDATARRDPDDARPLAWRGLGSAADLDLELGGGADARAVTVTRLVAACCADPAAAPDEREAAAWRLTLAGRIGGVAAVVALTRETDHVALALRCPAAGCGERSEVELPLDALVERARRAERERVLDVAPAGRAPLRLRRPTGEDQRRWQARRYPSAAAAERALLASLLVAPGADPAAVDDAALDDALLADVAAAMDELDPLPGFAVASACPACGAGAEHAVDLEALLLAQLARWQRGALAEVHRLASRYGWSEAEVMALPAWRRRAYLALLDAEEGRP